MLGKYAEFDGNKYAAFERPFYRWRFSTIIDSFPPETLHLHPLNFQEQKGKSADLKKLGPS
jgi:hypothetical protein